MCVLVTDCVIDQRVIGAHTLMSWCNTVCACVCVCYEYYNIVYTHIHNVYAMYDVVVCVETLEVMA